MRIKLKKITLKNFKGIDFTFELNCQDVTLYGDNKAGKTTLMDAVTYLFTDQNSKQQSKFNIKKLNLDGGMDYGQESTVEGLFIVDNERELYLKKTFIDKWSSEKKKRLGEIPGETTIYHINDSENVVTKKQYVSRIEEIAPMSVIKNLINPVAFPTMKPDEQRKVLMGMINEVPFKELCAANPKISELPDICGQYSVDEYRSILKGNIKKINEEKTKNPVKVKTAEDQKVKVEKTEKEIKDEIKSLSILIDNLKVDPNVSIQNKIDATEIELDRIKAAYQKDVYEKINTKESQLNKLYLEIQAGEDGIKGVEITIKKCSVRIDNTTKSLKACRAEWVKKDVEKHDFLLLPHCPTCKKPLTEEESQKIMAEEIKIFNNQKAENLKSVIITGENLAKIKAEDEKDLEGLKKNLEEMVVLKNKKKGEAVQLVGMIDEISRELVPPPLSLITRLEGLKAELKQTPDENNKKRKEFENNKISLQEEMALIYNNKRIDANIKEYKRELKALNKHLEEKERQEEMINAYEKIRVEAAEGDINSLFEITTWKLFDVKKNGEVTQTCVALNEGVPYSTDLNDGHKKAVGVDIIKTLFNFYDVQLPIFVDNCESVTDVPVLDGTQVIKLIKPEITEENRGHYSKLTDVKWENK